MSTYTPTQATAEVVDRWKREGKTDLQELLNSMKEVEEKEKAA